MKTRNFLMFTLAIGLIAGASAFKVEICHNTNNNPVTINIAFPAVAWHLLLHDDWVGNCETDEVEPEPSEIQK
jgi:hypothetical protein